MILSLALLRRTVDLASLKNGDGVLEFVRKRGLSFRRAERRTTTYQGRPRFTWWYPCGLGLRMMQKTIPPTPVM